MHADHYRDLIIRSVDGARTDDDDELLRAIAAQLASAEHAHGILRAKGYGINGMLIDATARLVPNNDLR